MMAINEDGEFIIKDGDKPYGNVEYADPGYQSDGKKRYPIDTADHIRSAWNYINKAKNAGKYTSGQLKKIKSRIIAAWKKKIDSAGPPSAKKEDAGHPVFDTETAWNSQTGQLVFLS